MPAKVIMVQGTMSNAGKSFITAGLLRVFYQDGYRAAPFKSQNMALNSYITKDGLEIGRAQAMQAEAACIEPTVLMNPILLKPTSDSGSQVIVNGRVIGNLTASAYYQKKLELVPEIKKAYYSLAEQYDIIVIEGAGSPAEINLLEHDIVNMGMAAIADAPVLLVGDIDRGGVFASLYGTVELLENAHKDRIKGLIINKFRGDKRLLDPGLKMIEDKTKIPVIGVVPMEQIDIDDEDSLSERLNRTEIGQGVDIAVIRLPHISNFTDFAAFERLSGVSLRYVSSPGQLKMPDLIILPGTKNTMADLKWLREQGFEALIIRLSGQNVPIMGICGGFQMLGRKLEDSHGVEYGGIMQGLSLLDAKTIFCEEKTRTRSEGRFLTKKGIFLECPHFQVEGYEIHMGITENLGACIPLIQLSDGRTDGLCNYAGNVFGTYLHGLFDTRGISEGIAEALARNKGIELKQDTIDLSVYKEEQYDKLADLIRQSLDMEAVYEIMG